MGYGRTNLATNTIFPTRVSADGNPQYKAGGVTISWASVTAASGDVTLGDGSIVKDTLKYLRYGQVLTRITTGTTITLTSTATGGSGTLTFIRPDNGQTVATAAIAYNATAATILTAVQAVMGPGQAVSASGGALNSAPVLVLFNTLVGVPTVGTGFTGGSVVPTASVAGTYGGFYAPYDPSASDGTQTLTPGDCFILDQTVLQYGSGSAVLSPSNDQIGGVFDGGYAFQDRILHSGTATHTKALGPTLAEIKTAFPRIAFVKD